MIEFMQNLHPVLQALIAASFTWTMTAFGASVVFLMKGVNRKLLDGGLGFTAGVMIAASYWSLLAPSIEMSEGKIIPAWLPAAVGFLLGGVFLYGIDKIIPHLHRGFSSDGGGGIKTSRMRTKFLILAITIHNIPEGLAVGVAFGAISAGLPFATFGAAVALAIGIGIQNFPEGLAVSMPLRGEGMSRLKSFWYGQLSAVVEPIFAVMGAAAVIIFYPILPYALAFAAGAMIFVVVMEVVPESQRAGNIHLATTSAMVGFALMMVLDVAFG